LIFDTYAEKWFCSVKDGKVETAVMNEFLKKIELFSGLNDDELAMVVKLVEIREFDKDVLLFQENGRQESLYLIYDGEIELFKKTPFGEEKRLSFFGKYDFLGEGALLDDYPHSTTARTLLKTVVFTISADKFREFCAPRPELEMKIISSVARVISRRMRQSGTRMINVAAQYVSGRTRSEHDLLGDRKVPYEFLYGIQTLRALENFNISGISLTQFPALVVALAMVKLAAARANFDLGLLSKPTADAICQACTEIINGKNHSQFVVDVIQGGAGTSTNMNANEVIANRALEILGYERGEYRFCHPNNHVNLSQSTNDAYPTALKIAQPWAAASINEFGKPSRAAVFTITQLFSSKEDNLSP